MREGEGVMLSISAQGNRAVGSLFSNPLEGGVRRLIG